MRTPTLAVVVVLTVLGGCDSKPQPPAAEPASTAQVAPAPASQAAPQTTTPTTTQTQAYAPPPPDSTAVPQEPVYEDYRPPVSQPKTIAVPWAPPPMRAEAPPPPPSPDAVWTGGYWVWHDGWAWAPGHWAEPPHPRYHWVPPYYEHRHDRVLFIDGFWSPPGVAFAPPPPNLAIALTILGAGIVAGRPPIGPEGSFVPPPPGSRWGLIVPAPIGTAPAVVMRAPAIVNEGMRVTNVKDNIHDTTLVNRNTTIVNQVTIVAPASATADHRDVHVNVPASAHLAAVARPEDAASERPAPRTPPSRDEQEQAHGVPATSHPPAAAARPSTPAASTHAYDPRLEPEMRHQAPPPPRPESDTGTDARPRNLRPAPGPKNGMPATRVLNDAPTAKPPVAKQKAPPPHAPPAGPRPAPADKHAQPGAKEHAPTPPQKKEHDEEK